MTSSGFYRRFLYVTVRLLPFAIAALRDRNRFVVLGGPRRVPDSTHRRRAERLTATLLELGPAFIKAGQVLSTRPDLVPPVYAEALSSLQDEVPEDTSQDPKAVIETDLDTEIEDLTPLAGGSLAYVYTATIEGQQVALKVRRPGLESRIERDLRVIRRLVGVSGLVAADRYRYSLRNIADDFERIIGDELDFEREARMMAEIRSNLDDDDRVYVPDVDLERTTERLLVMEHVEAESVAEPTAIEAAGVGRTELAERICEVYLQMGLRDGVFHADPHPGNLALRADGTLVIYDFGMSQRLSKETQRRITDLYRALARRDVEALIDVLIALDVLEATLDRQRVRTLLRLAMENLEGREDIGWRDLTTEVFDALQDVPFRIPPNVMLLIRVGTVAEGVCRQLDAEFDFLSVVRSFLIEKGFLEGEIERVLQETATDLRASLPVVAGLPRRLDDVLETMASGGLEVQTEGPRPSPRPLGYALIAGAFLVSSALLAFHPRPYEVGTLVGAVIALCLFVRTS